MEYTLAFDLGGTSLKYGYGNREKGLLFFDYVKHQATTLSCLLQLFTSIINDMKKQHIPFTRICIAAPGTIDAEKGIIIGTPPNLSFLKNVNLKEFIDDIARSPAYIDNDANMMTYAEFQLCLTSSVLGITVGTGIGSGFVQDKKVLHGEKWMALEIGHTIAVPNGRQCLCGKKGCLEAYASAESIKRIIYDKYTEYRTLNIYEILNLSNPSVKKEIFEILDLFALTIANTVMTLNPGTVVLGGGVMEIESYDFDYLKSKVYDNLMPEYRDFYMKKAEYGNKAGVIGAILYEPAKIN